MKTRYKLAFLFSAIFFLILLPHDNLLNQVEGAFNQKPTLVVQKATGPIPSKNIQRTATEQKEELLTKLKTILSPNTKYAVSIYDINGNEAFGINENQEMLAASVMKLEIAATAFRQIEAGNLSLDSLAGVADVRYQLQQMINQSNNDSWDLLNNLIGINTEQATADNLGLSGLQIMGNQMTSLDANNLLLQLYQGKDISLEHRNLLFSWMQNTETEDRITSAIPDNVTIYHKTGTLVGVVNDAAIVIDTKNPFILTIFTQDDTGTINQTQALRNATKEVYNYFETI